MKYERKWKYPYKNEERKGKQKELEFFVGPKEASQPQVPRPRHNNAEDTLYKKGEVTHMAKMLNLIVSDVGKKSVTIGTAWYDESRKAILSGYLSKDAISQALKDGTVSLNKADPKASRFLQGHLVFRFAGFPVTRGAGKGVASTGGLD